MLKRDRDEFEGRPKDGEWCEGDILCMIAAYALHGAYTKGFYPGRLCRLMGVNRWTKRTIKSYISDKTTTEFCDYTECKRASRLRDNGDHPEQMEIVMDAVYRANPSRLPGSIPLRVGFHSVTNLVRYVFFECTESWAGELILPEVFYTVRAIQYIDLTNSGITRLSDFCQQLRAGEILDLAENNLTTLPSGITHVASKMVRVDNNALEWLSKDMRWGPTLETLSLDHNPLLCSIPAEFAESMPDSLFDATLTDIHLLLMDTGVCSLPEQMRKKVVTLVFSEMSHEHGLCPVISSLDEEGLVYYEIRTKRSLSIKFR